MERHHIEWLKHGMVDTWKGITYHINGTLRTTQGVTCDQQRPPRKLLGGLTQRRLHLLQHVLRRLEKTVVGPALCAPCTHAHRAGTDVTQHIAHFQCAAEHVYTSVKRCSTAGIVMRFGFIQHTSLATNACVCNARYWQQAHPHTLTHEGGFLVSRY